MGGGSGQKLKQVSAAAVAASENQVAATQVLPGSMAHLDNARLGGYDAVIKNLTGSDLSNQQAVELVQHTGLPQDFAGQIWIRKQGKSYTVEALYDGIDMKRTITPPDKVKNDHFFIDKGSRFDGRGGDIFNSQVNSLSKAGFKQLEVEAGGNGKNRGPSSMNGYYTWLRLGYKPSVKDEAKIVKQFHKDTGIKVKNTTEMMSTEFGRNYWKDNGFNWKGSFDLTKGSDSMKVLTNYRKGKGK